MIDASAIAHALGGRKSGSGWICKCVAHDDTNPSLSISDGGAGKILVKCFSGCDPRDIIAELDRRGLWPEREKRAERGTFSAKPKPKAEKERAATTSGNTSDFARRIWRESLDPRGTFAERYLTERGLKLPADPEILLRTLRFHPTCFDKGPALVAAFTPIEPDVPADPFLDPPVGAIHRIRGRGHENKRMLGPVGGCAIMISPWWHVHETLHVTEGLETALSLFNEGAEDPEDARRPIWALGSAGAIRSLPIVNRVRRLVIWADNDPSGTGLEAAKHAARRWQEAGKEVVVRFRNKPGADYADR